MPDPINLTELRKDAHYQPSNERRSFHTTVRTETLLALIDTAEAAIAWYADMGDNSKTSGNYKRLRETLTRYTTNQP